MAIYFLGSVSFVPCVIAIIVLAVLIKAGGDETNSED